MRISNSRFQISDFKFQISNLKFQILDFKSAAFTMAEMIMGLAVTALVAAAAAGMISAVGQGWKQTQSVQQTSSITTNSALRIQNIIRLARQLGTCRTGSLNGYPSQGAAVMLWKGDINGDGKTQFSELAMLEHHPDPDPSKGTILYWDVAFPSSWNAAQKAAADSIMADNAIYSATVIDDFKTMANVRSTVKASGVAGAVFRKIDGSTTTRPKLEYQLKLRQSDGTNVTEYGTTAMRPPATLPAGQ
jgi:hypothetical protein